MHTCSSDFLKSRKSSIYCGLYVYNVSLSHHCLNAKLGRGAICLQPVYIVLQCSAQNTITLPLIYSQEHQIPPYKGVVLYCQYRDASAWGHVYRDTGISGKGEVWCILLFMFLVKLSEIFLQSGIVPLFQEECCSRLLPHTW